jgi:hypothetical protein
MVGTTIGNADAAYLIKLKNGNEYVTARYWRKGSQVLFDSYDGVFGIDHGFISKIERSDRTIATEITAKDTSAKVERQPFSVTVPEESQNGSGDAKNSQPPNAKPAPVFVKKPLKKDEDILKQYGELQQRFGQLNDLPKHEIYALDADIESLRKKVLNSDLAEAHKDEMDALATLRRAIASYLKAANP